MANTFLGLDTPNIAHGWGKAPELQAPNIGALVGNILENRRWQQANTQKNIADTIKNVQAQRQSQAYLEAAQQAGILPEGDLGPLGVKGASLLAQEIMRKKEADARAAHLAALTAHVGSGRGRGGGGGGGGSGQPGEATGPEFVYDADGTKYLVVRTSKSVTYHRVPGAGGAGTSKLSPTEKGWAAPEIPGVSVDINAPDQPGTTLQPNVPPMSEPPSEDTTMPSGVIPSDKAGGHAQDYGVPPVGTIRNGFRFKGGDPSKQENWEPTEPRA